MREVSMYDCSGVLRLRGTGALQAGFQNLRIRILSLAHSTRWDRARGVAHALIGYGALACSDRRCTLPFVLGVGGVAGEAAKAPYGD